MWILQRSHTHVVYELDNPILGDTSLGDTSLIHLRMYPKTYDVCEKYGICILNDRWASDSKKIY